MNKTEREGLGRAISRVIDCRMEPLREVLRLALARIEKLEADQAGTHNATARYEAVRNARPIAAHNDNRKQKEHSYARRLR